MKKTQKEEQERARQQESQRVKAWVYEQSKKDREFINGLVAHECRGCPKALELYLKGSMDTECSKCRVNTKGKINEELIERVKEKIKGIL